LAEYDEEAKVECGTFGWQFLQVVFLFFEISTGTTNLFLLGNRQALKLTTAGPNSHVFEF
jgi:hypothetical protein